MSSVELRREIEDLALGFIVADPDEGGGTARWIPALEKIRERALREQASGLVAAAGSLLDQMRDPRTPEDTWQDGISALQKALDSPAVPAPDVFSAQDPELISDFIVESREHLANVETQVLTLEREPTNSEALNAVFRGFHTIKGLAGFLELPLIQDGA